jgi:hypothetical protein
MEDDYKVKIALLERDIQDIKKVLKTLQQKAEKKPIKIYVGEYSIEAYCPNCGVKTQVPFDQDTFGSVYTWDDIKRFLVGPHEHGENILKCEKCGPKFREWLQNQGYELVPVKPKR